MKRYISLFLLALLAFSSCGPEHPTASPSAATATGSVLPASTFAVTSTPSSTPIPAVTVSFYPLRIVYSTTSNWNRLEFLDADCFLSMRTVDVQGNTGNAFSGPLTPSMGSGQPDRFGLFLNRTINDINLDQEIPLSMTIDAAIKADGSCQSLRFEEHRGAFFLAKVAFYLNQNGQFQLLQEVPLAENAKFTVDISGLYQSPPVSAVIRRPAKMLWAMYFPWFPGYGWDFSSPAADHPQILNFSSEDPSAVAYQIQQAKSAGIDGFFVSYNGQWLDDRLKILLDAAQANDFHIALHLEITDTAHNRLWDTTTIKQWIVNVIAKFGDHPALMKLNGKPLFAVYMADAWPRAEWVAMFAQLDQTGYPASFISMGYNLTNLRGYDGMYDLSVFTDPALPSSMQLTGHMVTDYALLQDGSVAPKIWMAPVSPGFDNTPWLGDATYPGKLYVVPRDNGKYYRSAFESVLQSDPDWILINTWNEYGEETHIEPSQRYGNQYLEITKEFAAQWKGQSVFPPEPALPSPTSTPDFSGLPTPNLTPNPDPELAKAQSFANLILQALVGRKPDYQDNFSTASVGWSFEDGTGRVQVEDGRLRLYVDASPSWAWATNQNLSRLRNFVLQVDAWPETPGYSGINLLWRFGGTSWYHLDLGVDNPPWNIWYSFNSGRDTAMIGEGVDKSVKRGEPVHIMLVVYGEESALYLNGHPVAYMRDSHKLNAGEILLGASADPGQPSAVVVYDNLKLWNLAYIQSALPTSTPVAVQTTTATNPATVSLPDLVVPDFIGVNIHTLFPDDKEMQLLADSGSGLVRTDLIWSQVEREKGQYDFSVYDKFLAKMQSRGIRVMFILASMNELYDSGLSPHTDEGRAAFAAFASAAAAHFAGKGVLWDFWNEPDQPTFWKPTPNLADWAALAKVTIPAMRQADPQAIILGPGISHADSFLLEQVGGLGVLPLFDAVAVHPYRPESPESILTDYASLRSVIQKYSPDKPLSIASTEWGYARNYWTSAPNLTDEEQAQYLVRQILINAAANIRLSIWYDWSNDSADSSIGFNNFGILDYQLNPKPAYYALQTLTRTLRGYRFVQRMPETNSSDYVLQFSQGTQTAFAAWTTGSAHNITLPVSCAMVDIVQMLGQEQKMVVSNGVISISLNQLPQYVICNGK